MTTRRDFTTLAMLAAASGMAPFVANAAPDTDKDLQALYAGAKKEGKAVFYTSVPNFILDDWRRLFEKTYPGVDLELFRSGTGNVIARVEAERRAGQVQGDLIWVADQTVFPGLIKQNLLAVYRCPEWDKVGFGKDPGGHFVMGRVLAGVIFANSTQTKTIPTSWHDLTKPIYKDQIALASPLVSGSMADIVGAMVHDPKYGWDYFRKLKRNGALVLQDVPDTARAAASGQRDLGVTLTMYKYEPALENAPIKIIYPSDGTVLISSPFGIFRQAQHPMAARLLYRFLLSKPAQQILSNHGIFPARLDVPPPAGMPSLAELKKTAIIPDANWVAANQTDIKMKWRALFGH
jgi:iron(III) transport system substrate-binding protein